MDTHQGRIMKLCSFILSSILMCTSSFSAASNVTLIPALASAINERLKLMKNVAEYKAEKHLPVEDLKREKIVLAKAAGAAFNAGLDPLSVNKFIQNQMNAGKAIQYRYRASFLFNKNYIFTLKPMNVIRNEILKIDSIILDLISRQLVYEEGFKESQKHELFLLIKSPYLLENEKKALIDSISIIKRRS